jgi:hypothetical protein
VTADILAGSSSIHIIDEVNTGTYTHMHNSCTGVDESRSCQWLALASAPMGDCSVVSRGLRGLALHGRLQSSAGVFCVQMIDLSESAVACGSPPTQV